MGLVLTKVGFNCSSTVCASRRSSVSPTENGVPGLLVSSCKIGPDSAWLREPACQTQQRRIWREWSCVEAVSPCTGSHVTVLRPSHVVPRIGCACC